MPGLSWLTTIDGAGRGLRRHAAEQHPAVARRNVHGVGVVDRREQAEVLRGTQSRGEPRGFIGREIRADVLHPERLTRMRRRIGRVRLRRPALLAGHVGFRHRPFFDRPDRLAGVAVEHVQPRRLGAGDHHVARAAVVADRGQLRRGARIEIPEVMVHELEVPPALSRARVERDERRAEQVAADAIGAVEVIRGRARAECRRCLGACRPSSRPSCSRRRCTSRPPSATCRSRTRRAAGPCGRSTPTGR